MLVFSILQHGCSGARSLHPGLQHLDEAKISGSSVPTGAPFSLLRIDPHPAIPSVCHSAECCQPPPVLRELHFSSFSFLLVSTKAWRRWHGLQESSLQFVFGNQGECGRMVWTKQNSGRKPASNLEASPGSLLFLYNFRFMGSGSPYWPSGAALAIREKKDVEI